MNPVPMAQMARSRQIQYAATQKLARSGNCCDDCSCNCVGCCPDCPSFTPRVGVAPGTTTMSLGGVGQCLDGSFDTCPPDETWQYVVPPDVVDGYPSGVNPARLASGSVVYPSPGMPPMWMDTSRNMRNLAGSRWNPYVDIERLRGMRGLGGASDVRWSVVLLAAAATFGVVLGAKTLLRRRKR